MPPWYIFTTSEAPKGNPGVIEVANGPDPGGGTAAYALVGATWAEATPTVAATRGTRTNRKIDGQIFIF
jgi:hypothetical protein